MKLRINNCNREKDGLQNFMRPVNIKALGLAIIIRLNVGTASRFLNSSMYLLYFSQETTPYVAATFFSASALSGVRLMGTYTRMRVQRINNFLYSR